MAKEFIDTGKIRYAMLDLPLESIHPLAFKAAEAVECAGDQGKFWEMHDRIFANARNMRPWAPHAEAIGIDVAAFAECLDSDRKAEGVRRDMAQARKAGATGTPAFLVALTDPSDPTKVKGLSTFRGAVPFNTIKAQLDQALASLGD